MGKVVEFLDGDGHRGELLLYDHNDNSSRFWGSLRVSDSLLRYNKRKPIGKQEPSSAHSKLCKC